GGMLPLLAIAIVAATGNIYNGLWYPILVALMTAAVGGLLLRDTKDIDISMGSGVEAGPGKGCDGGSLCDRRESGRVSLGRASVPLYGKGAARKGCSQSQ